MRPARWARIAADRVPTKWFVTGATGVFLIATATFGGLADVEKPGPAVIELGDTFTSPQLSLTVREVVLLDHLDDLSVDVAPGERAIAVIATVDNEWTKPQLAATLSSGVGDVIALQAANTHRDTAELLTIARIDDPETSPTMQPGVPVPLAFVWSIPAEALGAGDEVTVELFTQKLYTGTVTVSGQWWTDPALTAIMTLPVTARASLTTQGAGEEAAP